MRNWSFSPSDWFELPLGEWQKEEIAKQNKQFEKCELPIQATSEPLSVVWKREGRCPQCGELGPFITLAATCSTHGGY